MKAIKLTIASILLLSALFLVSFKCRNTIPKINNANSVGSMISQQQFNTLFPMHDKFYSYAAFITAVNQLGDVKMKITRRAASVYQFIRTDKHTGKTTTIRQDEDWNETWAKAKPDSSYIIDYGKFCTEKDIQTNKKEL